jgi:hypothetical protein
MGKYFQIYNYSRNLRARLEIYQLNGKVVIWWKETKTINKIRSNELTWKIFKKYIKQKYLTERYFNEKAKEFDDLKLRQMTIEDPFTKFVNLMRCVPYLGEEKAKVHRFMSSFHQAYKDNIKFLNPKMMDVVIRHAKFCSTHG